MDPLNTPAPPLKKVTIYSDGGCEGNPGPGGWGAILIYKKHRKEIRGGAPATTNNRMEMQAAIEGLKLLKERCDVDFHTDSEYLREGITSWVKGWKYRGWKTKDNKPVKNKELWIELDQLAGRHQIQWHWVKGHSGHPENERCDVLAQLAIADIKKAVPKAERKELLAAFKLSQAPSGTGQIRGSGFI